MLAIVVLLAKPRQHVIVPEKYIHGLYKVEHQLKTWGVNHQHKHVIFWKRSFLDDAAAPDSIDMPDFHLTPLEDFPPPLGVDIACYFARIKRFFGEWSIEYSSKYKVEIIKSIEKNMYHSLLFQIQSISFIRRSKTIS